jgi:hypothetical protein
MLELIYYIENYDKDVLVKKEHFEHFIGEFNRNFIEYQNSEYVQDLLSVWMKKFFDFGIATHFNPLFYEFCENIFTLENAAFVGSVIRDIYGWYTQNAIRRKNRKSLFQFLMKKLPEVETPYAMEILESMIFHIHRHDRWEFWDEWFTTQFRDMLQRFPTINTVYDAISLFARLLDQTIPTPLFPEVAQDFAEVLKELITPLESHELANKSVFSKLRDALHKIEHPRHQLLFSCVPETDPDHELKIARHIFENLKK